jgi:hypothetical protein
MFIVNPLRGKSVWKLLSNFSALSSLLPEKIGFLEKRQDKPMGLAQPVNEEKKECLIKPFCLRF